MLKTASTMKIKLLLLGLLCWLISVPIYAEKAGQTVSVVKIPYMERAGFHREYADALLELALKLSADKYGPYEIVQQRQQTVIRRQLLEIEVGENLSAAVSMPTPDWLAKARIVRFPIMKGMGSYRMFFAHKKNIPALNEVANLNALKSFKVGQGPGWSTGKILEDNGFHVIYGGPYETLLPMLVADRFQLLMRGVYEIVPELGQYQSTTSELGIVEGFAVYTYLPMYFFVSHSQPQLAERLEYGLKAAHASGQLDTLFNQFFGETLDLLNATQRKIFYLPNTNIDTSFYEHDKPYLLESVNQLELENRTVQIEK